MPWQQFPRSVLAERAGTDQRHLLSSVFVPDEVVNEILDFLEAVKAVVAWHSSCSEGRVPAGPSYHRTVG